MYPAHREDTVRSRELGRLYRKRLRADLTQAEVARRMGLTQALFSVVESGRLGAPRGFITKYREALK